MSSQSACCLLHALCLLLPAVLRSLCPYVALHAPQHVLIRGLVDPKAKRGLRVQTVNICGDITHSRIYRNVITLAGWLKHVIVSL